MRKARKVVPLVFQRTFQKPCFQAQFMKWIPSTVLYSVQERQRAEKLANTTCERDEFVRSEACRICNKGLVVQNITLFLLMLQWNLMKLRSPAWILLCLCCGVCSAHGRPIHISRDVWTAARSNTSSGPDSAVTRIQRPWEFQWIMVDHGWSSIFRRKWAYYVHALTPSFAQELTRRSCILTSISWYVAQQNMIVQLPSASYHTNSNVKR